MTLRSSAPMSAMESAKKMRSFSAAIDMRIVGRLRSCAEVPIERQHELSALPGRPARADAGGMCRHLHHRPVALCEPVPAREGDLLARRVRPLRWRGSLAPDPSRQTAVGLPDEGSKLSRRLKDEDQRRLVREGGEPRLPPAGS